MLPAERARASFDVAEMTNKLIGGEAKVKRRRWILGMNKGSEVLGQAKHHASRGALLEHHVKDFLDIHTDFGERMAQGKLHVSRVCIGPQR